MIYTIPNTGYSLDLALITFIGQPFYSDYPTYRKFIFNVGMAKGGDIEISLIGNFGTNKDEISQAYEDIKEKHQNLTNTWKKWKEEQSSKGHTGTGSGESGTVIRT